MDLNTDKNKHTSTLIRKKWKKSIQYRCCVINSCNVSKPMTGSRYCTTVKFYKSRNRKIMANQEIDAIMKNKLNSY